jgi:hypothetical protein
LDHDKTEVWILVAQALRTRLATKVVFDVKKKMNPDVLMITWRCHTSPHITKGFIFMDLIHFNTNGELPELVVIVLINLESMIAIIWQEDTKVVGRTKSFGRDLSLLTHLGKLYSALGNALE